MTDAKKNTEEDIGCGSIGCGTIILLFIIWGIFFAPSQPDNKQTTMTTQIVLWSGEEGDSVVPLSTLQEDAHIETYETSDNEEWVRISEYTEQPSKEHSDKKSQAEWVRADHVTDASSKETMYVSARKLNVRISPTTEAGTKEQLEQGKEVEIFEVTPDGWARISKQKGQPGERTADWVFAKYLSSKPVEPPKPVQTKKDTAPKKQDVPVSDVVYVMCHGIKQKWGAEECYPDLNLSKPNWMVIRIDTSTEGWLGPDWNEAELARIVCQGAVQGVTSLAKRRGAKAHKEWQVRIHTPFTGDHPIATCWMYR